MPTGFDHRQRAQRGPSSRSDRLLVGLGILLIGAPLLLGWPIDRAPAVSLIMLGALVAGTAATALCGHPFPAAYAALAFGPGLVMLLPRIGGGGGLLFNFGLLTITILIAARYLRRAGARTNR